MRIAVVKERRPLERRVAATPDTVKKFIGMGLEVVIESGAGEDAAMPDEAYSEAGGRVVPDTASALAEADIVLKVQRPLGPGEGEIDETALLKEGSTLVGLLAPYEAPDQMQIYAKRRVTAFSLERLPRITRAQSMDALSSQANLAGYKAVLDAASEFGRAFPLMMTAAGTVAPARVLVLGAGVAGLQAIATARRLGAIVTANDVRPEVKEQVESLGANFLEVEGDTQESGTGTGGYAKEMSETYLKRQAEAVTQALKKTDIVIWTALVPGKRAPTLVTEEMVQVMKPGSVIVDLAVEQGGNCALSRPGEVVEAQRVRIVGHRNVPSRIAVDASSLYARNLLNFLTPMIKQETQTLDIKWDDEIIAATALTWGGEVVTA